MTELFDGDESSRHEARIREATKPTPELALAYHSAHPNGLVPRIVSARVDGVHGPGEVSMWIKYELVDGQQVREEVHRYLSRSGGTAPIAEELAYRRANELAAINEMAKARREARDAESCRDTDRMLGHFAGEDSQGQFQRIYLRCKELERDNRRLREALSKEQGNG